MRHRFLKVIAVCALASGLLVAYTVILTQPHNTGDDNRARLIGDVESAADSGDWQTAITAISQARLTSPDDSELLAWERALAVKSGRTAEANWALCTSVSQCTEDGLVLLKLQLPQLARKTAGQLTALMPDNPTGSFISGASFELLGDPDNAYIQYQIAAARSDKSGAYTSIHVAAAARMQMLQAGTTP